MNGDLKAGMQLILDLLEEGRRDFVSGAVQKVDID